MKMPNFLIIGAAKSGTTSLASYLGQHPEIYMSSFKEPCFFAFEGQYVDFRGPGDASHDVHFTDLKKYCTLFQDVTNEKAIGEASTSYLSNPGTAERIKYYIPDIKLIAILRHPVHRAYSSYLHLVRDGREKITDFKLALNEEEVRIKNNWADLWRYQKNGFYYQQLKAYYEIFDRGQIKIYLYEDLRNDAISLLKDIFDFLEVDNEFVANVSIKHNVSGIPKSRILHNLLHTQNPIRSILGPWYRLLPGTIRKEVRKSNIVKPEMPEEIYHELNQMYREDILNLQSLINRDLSKWLN